MTAKQDGNSDVVDAIIGDETTLDTKKAQAESDDFFTALENEVNGAVYNDSDANPAVPPTGAQTKNTPETPEEKAPRTDWKKRYADSTREAQNLKERLNQLEPYSPLLNAMKNDSNLVNTVKTYLQNGGQVPQTVEQQLNLPEDYEFDVQNAFTNGDSNDAKVLDVMMDRYVTGRVNKIVGEERQKAAQAQAVMAQKAKEVEFAKKKGLSSVEMEEFKKKAASHTLTFDDAWSIVNRDERDRNIANSTKEAQMEQMKNARAIPASAAGTNSQGKSIAIDDSVFDHLLTTDGDVDNLFG